MNCKPCSRRVSLLDRDAGSHSCAPKQFFLWQTPRCAGAKNCNSMLSRECARRDFCHVHFLLCKKRGMRGIALHRGNAARDFARAQDFGEALAKNRL